MYLRTIISSTNLDRTGVTDNGRSSVKLFTVVTFGIGVTNALFHADGGIPVLRVLFIKLATAHTNATEQCLQSQHKVSG